MLGALAASTHVVSEAALEKAILDSVPKGTEALNLKAMKKGIELAKRSLTTMKLREYEAKKILREYGIPVPAGFLIRSAAELPAHLIELGDNIVLKAQVDVGGRGKAGGILMADQKNAVATAQDLFGKEIKGLPVREILAEQRLEIQHEYYLSITVDRSSRQPLILFTEAGGVDIEITAKEHPEAIHKVISKPADAGYTAVHAPGTGGNSTKRDRPDHQQTLPCIPGKRCIARGDQPAGHHAGRGICSRCKTDR